MWDITDFKLLSEIQELLGKLVEKQDTTNSLLKKQIEIQEKILKLEQEASDFFKNQSQYSWKSY